jgi:hypothetical protein
MNFGLLSDAVCEALPPSTKVVTWVVDEIEHLFKPNSKTILDQELGKIHSKITVYTFSSAIYDFFKHHHPEIEEKRLYFSASVTDPEMFKVALPVRQRNIVFIGTHVDCSLAIRFMHLCWKNKELRNWVIEFISLLEVNYSDPRIPMMLNLPVLKTFLSRHKIKGSQLKMHFANLVSASLRLKMVDSLSSLGIEVFGNPAWINALAKNVSGLKCFQSESISTREDLVRIYQSSKIAVQVPQIQVKAALSYRVFDIMASSSLLIHPYDEGSDLYRYFGKNCPVPTYRNSDELYQLCEYYLTHEQERLEKVHECNSLVSSNYSFRQRVFEMTGVDSCQVAEIGSMKVIYQERTQISILGTLLFTLKLIYNDPQKLIRYVLKSLKISLSRGEYA